MGNQKIYEIEKAVLKGIEFSSEILIPGVPFNRIVEELNNMKNAYQKQVKAIIKI